MSENPITPVGKLTPVNPNEINTKPVGKLTPVGLDDKFIAPISDFDPTPKQRGNIEGTINDIVKTSKGTILDSEKQTLRDLLTNPNTTPEQARETIQTIQGYHPKFTDKTSYYLKQDDNGVLVAKPLASGEKPPKGYNVASVWGSKKDAEDDSWYTDLGKSLYNGLVGTVEGVADVAQLGTMAITGEESKTLNNVSNALESLKMEKDPDLNKPIYNFEGIYKWADVLDKDRFDLSPEALWGTMNMAAESAVSFLTGAGATANAIKRVSGLSKLGKGAKSAAAFTGSYLTQLGDNLDNAREVGLTGRDAAAVASIQTAAQASIDAAFGLEAKIFNNSFKKSEKELMKGLIREIPKDAEGKITEEGFKMLARNSALEYGKLASYGAKEIGKDVGVEALQEAGQDFVGKAAEQLWDKLSPEDKAKFGTDVTSAKSFGSYMQNAFAGLIGGSPLAAMNTTTLKKKYDEQSVNAFDVVNGGVNRIKETKANLDQAVKNGDITEQERDNAIFKIDSYNKYADQMKDFPNMSKEDKKNAFELSFNIEALKKESDVSSEDLAKLDPIAIAKIDTKKTLIKGLQKELNHLLLSQEVQKETKVGQDTVNKVVKEEGLETEEGEEMTLEKLNKKLGKLKPEPAEEVGFEEEKPQRSERRMNNPKFDEFDKNGNAKFNTLRPLEKKEVLHDYFDANPQLGNELKGKVVQAQNNVWKVDLGNGRFVQFASSIKPEQFVGDTTNLEGETIEKKDSANRPYVEYQTPVTVKLESITGTDPKRKGKRLRILNVYNNKGQYIKSIKEKEKGNTIYDPGEIEQMKSIQERGYIDERPVQESVVQEAAMTPADQQLEQIDYEQTRPLEETEIQEELARKEAQPEYEAAMSEEQIAYESALQQQKAAAKQGAYQKVLERMQKNFPKVKIVLDNTIKGAGQVQGNTIKINPDYAGTDTTIHEAGHILIDAIGYNNKVIQSAIKQLKDTPLWAETKERYPELNEEMLGKEVLAEAIGRNGADIFDKQADKSKFMAFLEYIFNRLKQLLGLDKNIAISLAKQVIGGIGTKELVGKNEQVQEQRESYADMNLEDLVEEYNQTLISEEKGKTIKLKNLMEKIALRIKEKQIQESGKQLDDEQTTRDINGLNKWFKVLSHFSDAFPEMKGLSKIWNSAFFAKMKEAKEQKRTHDKLAAEVVKDRNKKLGIKEYAGQKLAQLISEQGDKYFGYLDDGKGKLITLDQANQKNLSKAQIDYLRYVREQLKDRALPEEDLYNAEMDVLRTDQGFNEAYRASGLISAIGSLIGSNNLSNVKLNFIDPKTGKEEKMDYIDIVNRLSKYSEGGVKEKLDATWQLLKYTRRAIKGRRAKGGEYFLDENGKLNNRFNQPVDTRKAYSKNFYNAMNSYIDESAHIRHISPLVPIVDSLQYMNEKGIINPEGGPPLHEQKKNVAEWIDKWKKLHIFKQNEETLSSDLDAVLKLLRFMTSAITMWFNVPANAINIALGNYNNWRDQNFKTWAKGQARLFGGKNRRGYGLVNKYALDLIDKYSAISVDTDSNPLRTAGNWFTKLAYLGQSLGETQIQGSGLLGLMSDDDYNSFEYNDKGDLVVKKELNGKPIDEKALEARILAHIDKVSDVQGKYGEKDRRNIMNNELGRALMAYKVWIPDALRTRFGEEGTVTKMFKDGFAELRADIREKGKVKAFWENKAFMSNLKGLMTIGLLMSVTWMDDDDDEKSAASKMFQRALSDVLFVFDPDNLKFTIKRPIAAIGAIEKLIDLGDHMVALGEDDFLKEPGKYGDKGDSKLLKDVVGLSPRPIKYAIDAILEED